jgi:hypothetical protein
MKKILGLALLVPSALFAFQPPPVAVVDFGTPSFGGSGCPGNAGTLKVLDQAKMLYEIDFDGFTVEAGEGTSRSFDRKACNIAIPLTVTGGFTVAVWKLQYSGFNDLNDGATAKISTEAFYAGSRAQVIQKTFARTGEFNEDIKLSEAEKTWSPCGTGSNFRLSLSDELKIAENQTLSSSKMDGKLVFQLEVKKCP